MHAGGGGDGEDAAPSALDLPDDIRIGQFFESLDLDAWALIEMKPDGAEWDEYARYVVECLSSGEIDTLIKDGLEEIPVTQWHSGETPLAVAMILYSAGINDIDVDDIMLNTPENTTPADYARACSLMGAEARALLFGGTEGSEPDE